MSYDKTNTELAFLGCIQESHVAAGSPQDFNYRDHLYSIGRCLAADFELVDAKFAVRQDKLRQIINKNSGISEPDRKWYLANLLKCRGETTSKKVARPI